MFSLISAVVIVLLTGFPQNSIGYKWITLNSNDTIPKDAIKLGKRTYVGRAVHYNLVLPAIVHSSVHAVVSLNKQEISKSQFEVLTATEHCEWKILSNINEVPPNVVLAGTAWNNEPIYIGKTEYGYNGLRTYTASILFNRNEFITWNRDSYRDKFALICDINDTWIDTSSANVPKNAVSGGTGKYFIGRLLGPSSWVLGKIIPKKKITIAEYDNVHMESPYSQVLVGDPNQYKWQPSKFGKIPDYAVPCWQNERGEIWYIVKINHASTQRLASELRLFPFYEVLVRNI